MRSALFLFIVTLSFDFYSTEERFYGEIFSSDSPILAEERGKIYLNPHRILATQKGIFLRFGEGYFLPLNKIYSDNSGIYISRADMSKVDMSFGDIIYCYACGKPKFDGEACMNPECFLNK